jgi:hypothetical protein
VKNKAAKADLLDLDDVERRLQPFARYYVGIRPIPIDRVVGTQSRGGAFARDFSPRHAFSRSRLRSLAEAFPDGDFPPIVVVKLGESYFVIDGHHRVAFARRQGAVAIDAEITEFVTPVPLPPGADMVEVVLVQLERVFLQESGLAEARPGLRVAASRPAVYLELLENLQVHGYHLMQDQGRVLDTAEIAADWYDKVYAPAISAVDRERLGRAYLDAPEADLFLLLHRHRREGFPSCGCPPLQETVPEVTAETKERRKLRRFTRR